MAKGDRPIFPGTITHKYQEDLQNAKFPLNGCKITAHCLCHTYNTRKERVLPE